MESDDACAERLGVQELQSNNACMLENAWPFSESKRKHKNAEFINKAMLEHCVRKLSRAILQQILPRPLLKLPDLLSDVPFYECRVPLKRFLQGSRSDILGHPIYPVRDFSLSGRPDFGEGLVSLPSHQECFGHKYKLIAVFLDIRNLELKNLLPEIHILPTHDSVERHYNFYDYFSHVYIVAYRGGAVLYKNDSCRVPRAISVGVCPIKYLSDRVR
jgi:hypothetical protein